MKMSVNPKSFVGRYIKYCDLTSSYRNRDTIVKISKIECVSGYPENMEPYYSVYVIVKNTDEKEFWATNLPESDFREDGKIFSKILQKPLIESPKILMGIASRRRTSQPMYPIDCPVCFESVDVPDIYITSCNHAFCKKCIHSICKKNIMYYCPLCRDYCNELCGIDDFTTDELYYIYTEVINTQESMELVLTKDLLGVIEYILTNDDKRLLEYLLYNSDEASFKYVYEDIIVNKKSYFVKINDPIKQFALALLHYKYH